MKGASGPIQPPDQVPSLSIIVAAYNAEPTLGPCLEALLEGGLDPQDEVLVVDDCSDDRTAEIARSFPCTLLRTPRNSGAAAARNLGASHSKGTHLLFVDADVVPPTGWRGSFKDLLQRDPKIDVLVTFPCADPPHRDFFSAYKHFFLHHSFQRIAPGELQGIYGAMFCITRELFTALGQFDERYLGASFEDLDLGLKARLAGGRIFLTDAVQWRHLHQHTWRSLLVNDYVRARGYVLTISILKGVASMLARHGSANNANPHLAINLLTSAGILGYFAGGLALAPLLPLGSLPLLVLCLGAGTSLLGVHLLLNREFLALLLRKQGPGFAFKGLLWGLLDYLIMGLGAGDGAARVALGKLTPEIGN